MKKITWRAMAVAGVLCVSSAVAHAQSCQFVGQRKVQRFWIEQGLGLVIVPTQDFDNTEGCTNAKQAIILHAPPHSKQVLASVMMAMATGTEINAYSCGCQSAWGQTYPLIVNFGVGGIPQ